MAANAAFPGIKEANPKPTQGDEMPDQVKCLSCMSP